MPDEKPQPQQNININMDPEMAKGVHGQDVAITVTDKDVCLTFYVRDPSGKQGFVTARIFTSHTTAIQMADLIKKFLGPVYDQYIELKKKLPPSAGEMTS